VAAVTATTLARLNVKEATAMSLKVKVYSDYV
jgi:hypothetical protein